MVKSKIHTVSLKTTKETLRNQDLSPEARREARKDSSLEFSIPANIMISDF